MNARVGECNRAARRAWRCLIWTLVCAWLCGAVPVRAQLATSFLSVTGIKVKTLPNAVQVRIETDGTVRFGTDVADWVDFQNGGLKPTQSIRLRIAGARSKLPTYVPIDVYPIDGVAVSLGSEDFESPYFSSGVNENTTPRVEVELRFAAPVILSEFSPDFGDDDAYIGPRQVSIAPSKDRRAILITVVPDRSDATAPQRLDRSPRGERHQHLKVTNLGSDLFSVDALHVPLRQLLGEVSVATGARFVAREEVADLPVTLFLNRASPSEFLSALQMGTNLGSRQEDGTLVLGRGDDFFASRTLPLLYLSPDTARLLYPDFLLPYLRPDRQNSNLLAVQTPQLLDKIEADLKRIDTPRAQFDVGAQIWQITATRDTNSLFRLVRSIGGDSQSLDPTTGQLIVRVQEGQTRQLSATLQALSSRGLVRLVGNPHVTLLSGATGSLFLGQTRFIKVLQQQGSNQVARALPLQIGTQLQVTARGSNAPGETIALDVAPRLSSVDAIESGTGLPTLAIRQISASLRVREGDSVLLAGLDADLDFATSGKTLGILPTNSKNREVSQLIALVTARRVGSSAPSEAVATAQATAGDLAHMQPTGSPVRP